MPINFEELLQKYMQHVFNHEGTTFANGTWQLDNTFTDVEKEYLVQKSESIHYGN